VGRHVQTLVMFTTRTLTYQLWHSRDAAVGCLLVGPQGEGFYLDICQHMLVLMDCNANGRRVRGGPYVGE
jgi:hypothetical protein